MDPTSSGAVAESEIGLKKEICGVRKQVSALERQNANLEKILLDTEKDNVNLEKALLDIAEDIRLRTCGRCAVRLSSLMSVRKKEGTGGYQRDRADMDVAMERSRARATCGQVPRRAGDWDCSSCNTVNFRSRVECFKCKRPKPLKAV